MRYNTFLKQFKQLIEQTTRYTPPNRDGAEYPHSDKYVDFPYVEDPTDFVTHRPLEQTDPAETDSPLDEQAINPEEAGAEGGLPADMAGGDMGMGGMAGGTEEEQTLTSSQIGRVYELKKIYSRLASIESYLSRATDHSILELRKYVGQSIDLFEVVMSNYEQYKENVDDIIVQFYEFLDVVYESIKTYYKSIDNEGVKK